VASLKIYNEGIADLVTKSKAIVNRSQAGALYVADMKIQQDLAADLIAKYPDGNIPKEDKEKILKAVPIVAAMGIASHEAHKDHYEFRVAAINARNPKNEANPSERALIEAFIKDPKLKENIEINKKDNHITVSIPVRIQEKQQCLMCHGHPSTSPWGNGKDILGYQLEDMKDGDIKGIFVIKSSIIPVKEQSTQAAQEILIWGGLITLIACFLSYLIVKNPIKKITTLSKKLDESSQKLTDAGVSISESSNTLSSSTQQQSSAITETAASLEEITAMLQKTSDNTNDSASSAKETQSLAGHGEQKMHEMVGVIDEIKASNEMLASTVKSGNEEISQIMKFIKEIEQKTSVINEIVFQTKLLSFNASVEASRAGEHGKGFAVVAEEVGRLAQISGKSAEEINKLLQDSVGKVQTIIAGNEERITKALDQGNEKIVKGSKVVQDCNESLLKITDSIRTVSHRIDEIAQASREQALGVTEIKRAIDLLSTATHTTADVSEASFEQSKQIKTEAEDLLEIVQELSKILKGKS
jgi:methyl-accepting chemotaxis protein